MGKVKITDYKTKRIEKLTGGIIKTHEVKHEDQKNDFSLSHSFLTKNGKYVGNYDNAWWYVKNNMRVSEKYPGQVATVHDKNGTLISYYGYSHRGGQQFKIGDRIFDEKYEPKKEDYTEKQWSEFENKFNKVIERDVKEGWFDSKEEALKNLSIEYVIPFKLRGNKIISTWEEAEEAAYKIAMDLS